MLTLERRNGIFEYLKTNKSARIAELSKQFFIGEATIRRDLEKLEKQGLIKRTYGGAVLIQDINSEIPLAVREKEQQTSKDIIGRLAADLISDGDIIILDSSSTSNMLVSYLKHKTNLTVVTNGLKVATNLGENTTATVYCTGGKLRENSLSFAGAIARSSMKKIHAKTLFFSCRGVSGKNGATDPFVEEADLRKQMIESASKTVLLCDHTKFNQSAFYTICDFSKIDYFITDIKPPADLEEALVRCGVLVVSG